MVTLGSTIDYRKLVKEERKRARAEASEETTNNNVHCASRPTPTTTMIRHLPSLPPWTPTCRPLVVPSLDRQTHCISDDPATIFYVPLFLPDDWCHDLWTWLLKLPQVDVVEESSQQQQQQQTACWHSLVHAQRKVALFDNSALQFHSGSAVEPFPEPLLFLVNALIQAGVFPADENDNDNGDGPPNHILINRYTADQGIMPHTDGPAYYPRTATISLGDGQVLLNFVPRTTHKLASSSSSSQPAAAVQVLLHGASLVVFESAAYGDWMHSIEELVVATADMEERAGTTCRNAAVGTVAHRDERISLTIRRRQMTANGHTFD
jgi:alkylated DNA repair protein alkB homolog 6